MQLRANETEISAAPWALEALERTLLFFFVLVEVDRKNDKYNHIDSFDLIK